MNGPFSQDDQRWMQYALEWALKGEGSVEPNPMVGCVIVSHGELIGAGWHQRFGGPHAEPNAIADARTRGYQSRLAGSTAYVTLEPCCHTGKTPPCTEALIQARVARVVVGMKDPFHAVAGGGIEALEAAGITVDVGLCAAEAQQLNAPFVTRITKQRPWLIAKWAMTLDGKIATRNAKSQWISGDASREQVHALRGKTDAILVGIGTALSDDPRLTARTASPLRTPARIVLDSQLKLGLDSQLVKSARQIPLIVAVGPAHDQEKAKRIRDQGVELFVSHQGDSQQRLLEFLSFLAVEKTFTNVLVEGGASVLGSLNDLRLIDQCEVYLAAKLFGGESASSPIVGLGVADVHQGPTAKHVRIEQVGLDVHLSCRLEYPDATADGGTTNV